MNSQIHFISKGLLTAFGISTNLNFFVRVIFYKLINFSANIGNYFKEFLKNRLR